VEEQGGEGIAPSSPPFRLSTVGVEDEAALVMALKEHHPERRPAASVGSCKRDRVRIVGLAFARERIPCLEQLVRVF
jgi:hypothetical protein